MFLTSTVNWTPSGICRLLWASSTRTIIHLLHVFLESETWSEFPETLSADVQIIFANYRSILAASTAWSASLSILPNFFRLNLCHRITPLLFALRTSQQRT